MSPRESHAVPEEAGHTEKIRKHRHGGLDESVHRMRGKRERRRERPVRRANIDGDGSAPFGEFVDEDRLRTAVEPSPQRSEVRDDEERERERADLRNLQESAKITDPSNPDYLSDDELAEFERALEEGQSGATPLAHDVYTTYREAAAAARAARAESASAPPAETPPHVPLPEKDTARKKEQQPPYADDYANLDERGILQKRRELQALLDGAVKERTVPDREKPAVRERVAALDWLFARQRASRNRPRARTSVEQPARTFAPGDFTSEYAHLNERQLRRTRAALEQLAGSTPPSDRPVRERDKPEILARMAALDQLLRNAARRTTTPRQTVQPKRTMPDELATGEEKGDDDAPDADEANVRPPEKDSKPAKNAPEQERPRAEGNVRTPATPVSTPAERSVEEVVKPETTTPDRAEPDNVEEMVEETPKAKGAEKRRPNGLEAEYATLTEAQLRKKRAELRKALETRFKKRSNDPGNDAARREVQLRLGAINRLLAQRRTQSMSPSRQDEAARGWLEEDATGDQRDNGMGGADELRRARERLERVAHGPRIPIETTPKPIDVAPEPDPDAQAIAALRADLARLEEIVRTHKVQEVYGGSARQEDVEREMLVKETQLREAERRMQERVRAALRQERERERAAQRAALEQNQRARTEDVRNRTAEWERLRDGTEPVPDDAIVLAAAHALDRLREEIREAERAIVSHTVQERYGATATDETVHALITGKEAEVRRLEQSIREHREQARGHATAVAYARVRAAEQALADVQQRLTDLDRTPEDLPDAPADAAEPAPAETTEAAPDHARADTEAADALAADGDAERAVADALEDALEHDADRRAAPADPYWRSRLRRRMMERIVDEGRGSTFLDAYVKELRKSDPEYQRATEMARDAAWQARRDSVRRVVRQLVPARAVMHALTKSVGGPRERQQRPNTEGTPDAEGREEPSAAVDGREVATDGDTVDTLLAKQLMKRHGDAYLHLDADPQRNGAMQRYVLDALRDWVLDHAADFGLRSEHDVRAGTAFDLGPAFEHVNVPEVMRQARALSAEQLKALGQTA